MLFAALGSMEYWVWVVIVREGAVAEVRVSSGQAESLEATGMMTEPLVQVTLEPDGAAEPLPKGGLLGEPIWEGISSPW